MAPKAAKATTPQETGDARKTEWTKILVEAGAKAPPKFAPYIQQAAPVIATLIVLLQTAWPHVVKYTTLAGELYEKLPHAALKVLLGFVLCFFGGMFPASIAAFEAFKLCGGPAAMKCIQDLYKEVANVKDAMAEDETKDADGDGKPDVTQMDGKQLVARKMSVAAKALDPVKINASMAGLYVAWAGVIATLKLKFARTVTLSLAISDELYKNSEKYVVPRAKEIVPEEHHKWVPIVAEWVCKSIAVSVAWWIQSIISAFHGAIRGGFMIARNGMKLANQYGYLNVNHKDTSIDEIAGYVLAFFGFVFQVKSGFGVPMLLNLVFWPLQIIEYVIEWQVSY